MAGQVTSSGVIHRRVNDAVKLTVTLVKNGNPLTGKTPKVKLIRRSDNKYYNWGLNVWQTPAYTRNLTENSVASGVYETLFDQSLADNDNEEEYLGIFTMNGIPAETFYAVIEYIFKLNLPTADVNAIRDSILNHILEGNTLGYDLEGSLNLLRKVLTNRLELADGSTNNWVLYDDDDATTLLTFSVTDKLGSGIVQPPLFPSRRTRGV